MKFKAISTLVIVSILVLMNIFCLPVQATPIQISMLAEKDAITDPNSLLRYSLPIDNEPVRRLQEDIEELSKYLRGKRWSPIQANLKDAYLMTSFRKQQILESVPEANKAKAESLIEDIQTQISDTQTIAETKDKEKVWEQRRSLLNKISTLEELMVETYPFEIPKEYGGLPQLKGRATVDLETTKGPITVVVDGYSAPINAGNFVDLVQRGFYDGSQIMANTSDFVVQFGKPKDEEGFIDPKTKEYRAIPLEYLIRGDSGPTYGITLEDSGNYLADLALPFSAYGTLALARPENDPNGGSSQVFFFKFDNELTPPGFNLMDGRYSVFGYLVEGKEVLENLTPEDKIISAKVVQGLNNLVEPS